MCCVMGFVELMSCIDKREERESVSNTCSLVVEVVELVARGKSG